MPLPPMYFPVYPWQFRLPEPGLHAQPLLQTPPTFHLEGLHTVQWIFSDTSKLSTTVSGDHQPFALRNFDSGAFIPHLPLPLSAGPFLLDTLNHSKYVTLFHQPNVQLDGSAVGVFFWAFAPPWRCLELKLPLPKFLAKRSAGGAYRKAKQAEERVESARKKLTALEDELASADLSPDQDAAIRRKIRGEEKKFAQHRETKRKQTAAYEDAQRMVQDVNDDAASPEPA